MFFWGRFSDKPRQANMIFSDFIWTRMSALQGKVMMDQQPGRLKKQLIPKQCINDWQSILCFYSTIPWAMRHMNHNWLGYVYVDILVPWIFTWHSTFFLLVSSLDWIDPLLLFGSWCCNFMVGGYSRFFSAYSAPGIYPSECAFQTLVQKCSFGETVQNT